MKRTTPVPGAPQKANNAYSVCQALAWIAKERRDLQEQVDRMREIPDLMSKLIRPATKHSSTAHRGSASPQARKPNLTREERVNNVDPNTLDEHAPKLKADDEATAKREDSPILADAIITVGTYYYQNGITEYAPWAETMTEVVGPEIEPFLSAAWEAITGIALKQR